VPDNLEPSAKRPTRGRKASPAAGSTGKPRRGPKASPAEGRAEQAREHTPSRQRQGAGDPAGAARPGGKLRVTQTRSTISHIARNRATVKALGLHRIGDTVEVADNPAVRGMVRQVRFLVQVEEIAGPGEAKG
jgi:large subunit ribosomal protein L30